MVITRMMIVIRCVVRNGVGVYGLILLGNLLPECGDCESRMRFLAAEIRGARIGYGFRKLLVLLETWVLCFIITTMMTNILAFKATIQETSIVDSCVRFVDNLKLLGEDYIMSIQLDVDMLQKVLYMLLEVLY
jgi:hypothetical protein